MPYQKGCVDAINFLELKRNHMNTHAHAESQAIQVYSKLTSLRVV